MKSLSTLYRVIIYFIFVFYCYGQSLTPTNGPYGGNIRSLAINSKGNLFAGTNRGLFYSTNDGDSWSKNDFYNFDYGVMSIITKDDSIIVASNGLGTYRSSDNGKTWSIITNGLTNTILLSITKTSIGDLFGASNNGVFRSTNNGLSWTPANSGLTNTNVRSIMVTASDYIFATTSSGIFRTNYLDGFWTEVNSGIANKNVWSIVSDTSGILFAGVSGNGTGIYKSTNNGNNWDSVYSFSEFIFVSTIGVGSKNEIFAGTSSGILRSTNTGTSWTEINNNLDDKFINTIVTKTNGKMFAGTNSAGVFRSTNSGDNWSRANEGIIKAGVGTLYLNPSNYLFAGSSSGLFRSSNEGQNWQQVGGLINASSIIQTKSNILWMASGVCADSVIYFSTDNGNSWSTKILPIKGISHLLLLNDTTILAFSSGCGTFYIAKSVNNGTTWSRYNGPSAWALTLTPSGLIFAATSTGISRSSDAGVNWTQYNQGLGTDLQIYGIVSNSKGQLFCYTSNKLFRLTDNFVGWTNINFPLNGIQFIAIDSKDKLYISIGLLIYSSSDNGDTWTKIIELTPVNVSSILIKSDNNIFLGTTDGVYHYIPTSTFVEDLSSHLRLEYSLMQNYPNPFNPTTIIEYFLPKNTNVSLIIYDMLGRQVKILEEKYKNTGQYRIEFNANDLSSGVYFYRLQTNDYSQSKKLILTK